MQDLQTLRIQIESTLVTRAESDATFRARLMSNPKAAIEEAAGLQFGEDVQIEVHEETPRHLHLVLPVAVGMDGELADEHLEAVAGGGSYAIAGDVITANNSIIIPSSTGISPGNPILSATINTSMPDSSEASNPGSVNYATTSGGATPIKIKPPSIIGTFTKVTYGGNQTSSQSPLSFTPTLKSNK